MTPMILARLLPMSLFCLCLMSCSERPEQKWKELLEVKLPRLEKAVQRMEFSPLEERTFAGMMENFQKHIAEQTGGKTLPIFLSPKVAQLPIAARRVQKNPLDVILYAPVYDVSVETCLRYICDMGNLRYKITSAGVLIWTNEENAFCEDTK